mmetsp:Transcript_18217/g.58917  ORF Transcript_18217/g.58917 Transcript_18217/m.58917 type:complete len:215 (-) Transcript_18217:405-1049(-)
MHCLSTRSLAVEAQNQLPLLHSSCSCPGPHPAYRVNHRKSSGLARPSAMERLAASKPPMNTPSRMGAASSRSPCPWMRCTVFFPTSPPRYRAESSNSGRSCSTPDRLPMEYWVGRLRMSPPLPPSPCSKRKITLSAKYVWVSRNMSGLARSTHPFSGMLMGCAQCPDRPTSARCSRSSHRVSVPPATSLALNSRQSVSTPITGSESGMREDSSG